MDIYRAYEVGYGHAKYGHPNQAERICAVPDKTRAAILRLQAWYNAGYGRAEYDARIAGEK